MADGRMVYDFFHRANRDHRVLFIYEARRLRRCRERIHAQGLPPND